MATAGREGPGIDGAIQQRPSLGERVVNIIEVPSLEETMENIRAAGGKLLTDTMTVRGVGYLVYFLDTEGNPCGALQGNPEA
jgi:predicted enzyme related to lactoylglutathione lyase